MRKLFLINFSIDEENFAHPEIMWGSLRTVRFYCCNRRPVQFILKQAPHLKEIIFEGCHSHFSSGLVIPFKGLRLINIEEVVGLKELRVKKPKEMGDLMILMGVGDMKV